MGLWLTVVWSLLSLCHAQFFAPSFAASPLPSFAASPLPSFAASPLPSFAASRLPSVSSFPGSISQSFSLPAAPKSKKSDPGIYSPIAPPNDPAANQALINLLTQSNPVIDDSSKTAQVNSLFDQNSFRSFNIEIPTQNVAIMNSDPTKEYKVHCAITTDYNTPQAQTFNDFGVGCAYKGSVGSLRVCLDENHQNNHVCRKLSIRVDARAFSPKGNKSSTPLIHGQHSLLFAGMPVDLSLMSERTAYYLMNSFGMIAPKAVHAKLFENGKYLGLFALVQPVDQDFTEVHFGNDARQGEGGLYKELWLNPLHMTDVSDSREDGANDDDFMRQVMAAIQQTPLTGNAPTQFFQQYFDIDSFIDMIAFNTAIGDTDDWRLRHNFYIYVRDDGFGKKLVWIPWDYDRLYDPAAATRGTLQGRPWWDISATANPTACNQQLVSPYSQAAALGGTAAKIAWNEDIIGQQSPDLAIPITCDKITQLMAASLGPAIRQRTIQMASQINIAQIRQLWNVWNAQIQTALQRDPSGPLISTMLANQQILAQYITNSLQKAVAEASTGGSVRLPSVQVPSVQISAFQAPSFSPVFQAPVFQAPVFQAPSVQTSLFQNPFQAVAQQQRIVFIG